MLTLQPLGQCSSSASTSNNRGHGAHLTVDACLAAVQECGAPILSLAGKEPLEYPGIASLACSVLDRGHHLFLSTDGRWIRRHLHMIPPDTNFFWNVRVDGTEATHEERSATTGLFREALDGIQAAKNAGFSVIVTSTIYPDTEVQDLAALYRQLHALHVDGYLLLPNYPDQKLCRNGSAQFHAKMNDRFREAGEYLGDYNLMLSPLYLEYLRGERELGCSVWGAPVYGPQGWSSPCSVLDIGYADSYKALLENTIWENYGRGLNPRCENCQCYSGYEMAALLGASPKAGDFWKMLAWQLSGNLGKRREEKRRT